MVTGENIKEITKREGDNDNFTCGITGLFMVNPVDTVCKHSFEKEALEQWLELKKKAKAPQRNDDTNALKSEPELPCPICRHNLRDTEIKPNKELKQSISEMIKAHPKMLEKLYCEKEVLLALEKAITEHDASQVTTLISLNKQAYYHELPTKKLTPSEYILCACEIVHITTVFDAFIKGLEKHINSAWQWQNEEGYNLFHVAVLSGRTAIATQIHTNFVQQDNNKLKLRTKNDEGILSLACRSENTDMVKWVLKLLGNQAKDEIIYTATDSFNSLMRACHKGDANMVKLFLDYYRKEQDEVKIFTKLLSNKEYNVYSIAARNKHNHGFLITLELNTFLDKTFGKEKRKAFVFFCDREVLVYSSKVILKALQKVNDAIKRSTERNTYDINEVAVTAAAAVVNFTRMTRSSNDHANEQESQSQQLINPASVPQSLFGSSANSSNNPTTTAQSNTASQPQSTRERSLSN